MPSPVPIGFQSSTACIELILIIEIYISNYSMIQAHTFFVSTKGSGIMEMDIGVLVSINSWLSALKKPTITIYFKASFISIGHFLPWRACLLVP